MCGIFGVILSEDSSIPEEAIEAASSVLSSRGPDSLGIHREPGVLMGMRRLAIINPEGPSPPFTNESHRFYVVGNGEIYNHSAIRHRLLEKQHRFSTGNDLEVLVHLKEEDAPDWELGLRGMFAFAIWDSRNRSVHLSRDRFGIKPLYWCGGPEGLAFASTLPALRALLLSFGETGREDSLPGSIRALAHPGGWRLNRQGLRWYLDTLCIPAPLTIYEKIHSLPPASRLSTGHNKSVQIERYWRPKYDPKRVLTQSDAISLFEESFKESVAHHLVSDVPVGAFLSGGIDSGYLVGEAASQMGSRLSTFTVGFRESDYSEFPLAAEMARTFGTNHHEVLLEPFDHSDIPTIVAAMNQPLGDSSAWPTWAISKAVGKHMKVALAGDGGDEIWGGYPYYALHNLGHWLPRQNGAGFMGAFRTSLWSRAKRVVGDLRRPPEDLYRRWRHLDPEGDFWNRVLLPEFQGSSIQFDFDLRASESHDALLERDLQFYLPSDLLEKVDSMSMAHSLEVRVPWLDPVFFEILSHLPSRLKINGGITKWLVRKAAERGRIRLPQRVLEGKKQGFAIPVHKWVSQDLRGLFHDLCLAKDSKMSSLMDLVVLRRYYEAHRTGEIRLGHQMWALLILEIWLRQNQTVVGHGE